MFTGICLYVTISFSVHLAHYEKVLSNRKNNVLSFNPLRVDLLKKGDERKNASRKHAYIILTTLNPTVKLEFTEVYIIFLISAQKHRLRVLVRTASF